jgi:hypothetical protein
MGGAYYLIQKLDSRFRGTVRHLSALAGQKVSGAETIRSRIFRNWLESRSL